jgi:hypothetical protein
VVIGLQANFSVNLPTQGILKVPFTVQPRLNTLPEQVRALTWIFTSNTSPLAMTRIESRCKGKGA